MALQKEQWIKDIEKNLYANNTFLNYGKNDSSYVTYKTVHLPQAGTRPSVEKDRAILPASISQRTDSELTYNLSEYSTDPRLINRNDDVQYLSYNKRMDVMGDQIAALGDAIANHTLYAWSASAAASQVRTTGGTTGNLVHSTATGTRKLCVQADIQNARRILDAQNLGAGRIFMVVPSDMFWNDLMSISTLTKYLEFGKSVLPTGDLPQVLGMNIIVRSSTQIYDNTGTPVRKVLDADGTITTAATGDNNSILVFHESYVRKALGEIKVYEEMDSPIYYGDIISSQVFHGASKSRTNGEGIVNIIQTVG
jgi:hypothetical protein